MSADKLRTLDLFAGILSAVSALALSAQAGLKPWHFARLRVTHRKY